MNTTTLRIALATAALADGPAAALALDTDERIEQLTTLVERLRGEIDELRGQDDDGWLTERRAEEIRGLVQDVLADADTRASLLQSGLTAGHDRKFFLASADGGFRLNIEGHLQVRYVYSNLDTADGTGTDANVGGFEIRRAKVIFSGHILDPTWTYKVQGAFNRNGGAFESEDVYIAKDLGNGFSVTAGQFKAPLLQEELVSSSRQLAVDRSLVNERFNQDRSIGVEVAYEADQLRAFGMFHNGLASRRMGWNTEDTEYAFTGRVEALFAGEWNQTRDFTSPRGSETAFMVGAAANYQESEYGTTAPNDDETKTLTATVDATLKGDGWNAFGAFVYQDNDSRSGADASPWGAVVQGGLFLTDEWELFARYEFGDNDTSGSEDLSVVTVGANRYWSKHALKWTTDVGVGLNEVQSPWASTGVGWRTDDAGQDGQVVVRSQLQLLF